MDFSIDYVWSFNIGGYDLWISRTVVNTWIIMAFLILVAIIVRLSLRKFKEVPTGFQNIVEYGIEMFDDFVYKSVGDTLNPLSKWFFTIFVFILISNISGIVGLRPPTADWSVTFALALVTFVLIQFKGIKYQKMNYIKSFFEPNFIFFPLNLIGELARPVSLSFRLFGNVLAGMILMTLVYSLAPIYMLIGIPAALHAYFDLFSGVLQTYIFCILSLVFIKGATE